MTWIPSFPRRGWLGARIVAGAFRLSAKFKAWWANRGVYPELGA